VAELCLIFFIFFLKPRAFDLLQGKRRTSPLAAAVDFWLGMNGIFF
jgi:hypothetical protein